MSDEYATKIAKALVKAGELDGMFITEVNTSPLGGVRVTLEDGTKLMMQVVQLS
jgi:hypothetical protein